MPESPINEPAESSAVPDAFRAAGAIAWRLVGIGLAGWGVLQIAERTSTILIPIAIGVLLTALLAPLVRVSRRRLGGSPYLHAGMSVVLLLAAISGVLYFVGNEFATGFANLRTATVEGLTKLETWLNGVARGRLESILTSALTQVRTWIADNTSSIASQALSLGGSAAALVAGFLLAVVTAIFFLADGSSIWRWVVGLFPRDVRATVRRSGQASWFALEGYARTQVIVAAVDAVGIGIGAALLSVPLVVPIMALVFLSAFVPIIGATISGALAVLLALVTNGWTSGLVMLGIVLAVMQVESHVLQPLLMGKAVNLHPWAVIIGVAVGALLMGVAGALFAVPVMAMVNAGAQAGRGVSVTGTTAPPPARPRLPRWVRRGPSAKAASVAPDGVGSPSTAGTPDQQEPAAAEPGASD